MKPIGIWYHCKISGEGIPDPDCAMNVLAGQMASLQDSGLEAAASEVHVGINGSDVDALSISPLIPAKSSIHIHGHSARTEIPTMKLLRDWLKNHPDWFVLYHHTKGVTHPGQQAYDNWRQRMEDACVWGWKQCVHDLGMGFDAVGCHWLTPRQFPAAVTSPFFGGTFWWATARYLSQLPPLPDATWVNRFEAESWIGRRRPYPYVRDYFPGWP